MQHEAQRQKWLVELVMAIEGAYRELLLDFTDDHVRPSIPSQFLLLQLDGARSMAAQASMQIISQHAERNTACRT